MLQVPGWITHRFEQVTSTMDVAHRLAAEGAPEKTLVVAERQEQGRGRMGRTWISPAGGAYFSLILRPTRAAAEIPQLSLVAGLALVEAIRELTGLFPSIRWPNDVLLNDKKVAGILVEARNNAIVIGIGINVTSALSQLPSTATSLGSELPRPAGRHGRGGRTPNSPGPPATNAGAGELTGSLICEVCGRFAVRYNTWSAQGFAPIREALRPFMGLFGQPVHIAAGSQRFEGTAQDVDESGRFVVRLDSGVLRSFEAGEVTLLRSRDDAQG